MKVLIVSAYPPDPAPEANHALHISERLADRGLSVHVLCQKESAGVTHPGIVVHSVMEDWSWSDAPRLQETLKTVRPDVVLLLYIGWVFNHHPMITYLPTFVKRVLPGVPCVTQFENVDEAPPYRTLVEHARRRFMAYRAGGPDVHPLFGTLLRDSATTIALSSPHRAGLLKAFPDVEERTVILPPPPLIRTCSEPYQTVREASRESIAAAPDDFVWMYWGYIYPGKGIETLFRAFRTASRKNRTLRLVLVGGPLDFPTEPISCSDYYQMVRELPSRLGIEERVTWTGPFDWDSDVGSRYLHAADACALPFDFGVTLNNSSLAAASAHGLPVIGTNVPEAPDELLEHGRNIYLCDPRNHHVMAEAIELISETEDLRERLRSGVRDLAREWHGWEGMTERLVVILKSAVEEGSASAPSGELPPSSAAAGGVAPEEEQQRAPSTPTLARRDVDVAASPARPPVSVVVAVYNVDKYLSQCLDALVHQTLPGVEVVVVNDASTDDSPAIIEAYRARYSKLRVVHCEQNRGLASVRNIGMSVATGEYIAFADGDDWVDVNMCEVLYKRARADDVDVVIADTKVFYEDTKDFSPFFDQPLRKVLAPELRKTPFDIQSEPVVLLLEPVAWTKIYRRSFLRQHSIRFEDGMNSYEDVCFHFWVLVKAATISLTDQPIANYRQNRPGQISGRRNRKVFEVFDVFRKIHDNLSAWNVSPDVWAMFLMVQIKQYDWMLRDRVRDSYKREFIQSVAELMELLPPTAFDRVIRYASREEMAKLACLRRGWVFAYERIAKKGWPKFPLADLEFKERWTVLARGAAERAFGRARRRIGRLGRSHVDEPTWTFVRHDRHDGVPPDAAAASEAARPFEVHRVDCQALLLASPTDGAAVADSVGRIEHDHYLTRTATLREGDTVVDVGAHVGTLSIFLAKKYPFLRVIAVEPEPRNYRCLVRNIEANGLTNVIALNKAIAGTVGEKTLFVDASNSAWATLDSDLVAAPGPRRAVHATPVDTMTLEELFVDHEVSHCRVLKLTALGAVGESLRAFSLDGRVDLLCGEVDLSDCTRGRLEVLSWRIARQFFWRTIGGSRDRERRSWLHHAPDSDEWRGLQHDAAPVRPGGAAFQEAEATTRAF